MTAKYSTKGRPTALEAGDVAVDLKQDERKRVHVVEHVDVRADEYVLYETDRGTEETIHSYHRGKYPADDDVYLVIYHDSVSGYRRRMDGDLDVDELLEVLRRFEVDQLTGPEGWNVTVYGMPESRLGRP